MIDLLSDTVTQPTETMLNAMLKAAVGDDVYGEDQATNDLEAKCAALFKKEAACFMPTGTMANLLCILAWCQRGYEVLVGDESDIYNYEAGGASVLGGVVYHPIKTQKNGTFDPRDLREAVRDVNDPQCSRAGLVCIENPHNRLGGLPLSLRYLEEIAAFCKRNGLPLHMDGARVFNASVAVGASVSEIAAHVDSLQFCFSKSLAAPVGSAVVGNRQLINEVRRLRKMVGGGMRQIGYLAACADVALDTMVARLKIDHQRARHLAEGLSQIPGLKCVLGDVQTNMVFFELEDPAVTTETFLHVLKQQGVRMGELGHGRIRAVVHYHLGDAEIAETVIAVRRSLSICAEQYSSCENELA